jgi:hypothetical protein
MPSLELRLVLAVDESGKGAPGIEPGASPSWWSVPACPAGSSKVRLNSSFHALVSVRGLAEPRGTGNL